MLSSGTRDITSNVGGDIQIGRSHLRVSRNVEAKLERDAGVGRGQHRLDRLAAWRRMLMRSCPGGR